MATAAQVAQFRAANASIVAAVERDLDNFFGHVDLSNPARALNALLQYIPLLTQRYGEIAAALAADWYEELRADAVEQGIVAAIGRAVSYDVITADPVAQRVARESVQAAKYLLETQDTPDAFISRLRGNVTRYVLQPSRDTITRNAHRDRAARGWARYTRPGTCDFCAALSGRGGVYTEQSARFASHDHCNCVTAPVFDPHAEKVDVRAEYIASAKTASMSPEQREQFRARTAGWIAGAADGLDAEQIYLD